MLTLRDAARRVLEFADRNQEALIITDSGGGGYTVILATDEGEAREDDPNMTVVYRAGYLWNETGSNRSLEEMSEEDIRHCMGRIEDDVLAFDESEEIDA